jgi:hypothetical protein
LKFYDNKDEEEFEMITLMLAVKSITPAADEHRLAEIDGRSLPSSV